MTKNFSITVDVGTTNTKVSLFEKQSGNLIDRETFVTDKKDDSFGELFDLENIWLKLSKTLKKYIDKYSGEVDSINFSSVGEAGVLLDSNGDIVTPLIAWYDKRALSYIEKLTEKQKERIYEITGLPAHSNYSLPKIKWLVDHLAFSSEETLMWMNIPDLFSYFLTGEMKTEFSMASRTLCYDLKERQWSPELLDIFDLGQNIKFPEVVASGEIVGYTDWGELKDFKDEHISVRIAGHDHMVGALGINLQPHDLLNSTGTTEGLLLIDDQEFITTNSFKTSLSNGIFTNPSYYTLFSSMPTGGNAFSWYQKFFNITKKEFEADCEELYQKYIKNKIELSSQMIFVPHLKGSGAPFKTSKSRGLIYGLTLETQRQDILFGLMVGLCLEMKYVSTFFPMSRVERVIAIGPVVKNKLWLQLKADSINKEISAVKMDEAVSFGALKAAYQEFSYAIEYQTIKPLSNRVPLFNDLIDDYEQFYHCKQDLEVNSIIEKTKNKLNEDSIPTKQQDVFFS